VNPALISGLSIPAGIAVSRSDLFVANIGTDTIGEYTTSGYGEPRPDLGVEHPSLHCNSHHSPRTQQPYTPWTRSCRTRSPRVAQTCQPANPRQPRPRFNEGLRR
jgi:hypothetical protein